MPPLHDLATEEVIEAILRGATKILGCGSASLIVVNERARQIRVSIGVVSDKLADLLRIRKEAGVDFARFDYALDDVRDSLVYAAWRDDRVLETGELAALAGSAFPPAVLRRVTEIIGEHRFIVVPARSRDRIYGVIIFEQGGTRPFSAQQREVLSLYAGRIGEIVDNRLRDTVGGGLPRGPMARSGPGIRARDYLLLDEAADIVAWSPPPDGLAVREVGAGAEAEPGLPLGPATLEQIRQHVRSHAGAARPDAPPSTRPIAPLTLAEPSPVAGPGGRLTVDFVPLTGRDGGRILCTLREGAGPALSLHGHLLQLALGDSLPAVFVDPGLRITSCNAAIRDAFGYGEGELVDRPIAELFVDAQEIHALLDHRFLSLSDGYHKELVLLRTKAAEPVSCRVEALLLADEQNMVVGYLLLLRRLEPTHAAVVSDRRGAEDPRSDQRERLAVMGEMAAQLAHEIRNPIVAVGATLESLAADTEGDDHATTRGILSALAKETSRLDMLLKDYLSLAGRPTVSSHVVSVRKLLEEARGLLVGASRTGDRRIVVEPSPDARLLADGDSLVHALFNVLLNAIDASPPAGEVRCRVSVDSSQVVLTAEDSGPGPGPTPERCFEPFFTTKRNGTGLGLTVCRRLVEQHGGSVRLETRREGGCRTVVTLPLDDPFAARLPDAD